VPGLDFTLQRPALPNLCSICWLNWFPAGIEASQFSTLPGSFKGIIHTRKKPPASRIIFGIASNTLRCQRANVGRTSIWVL